MKIRSIPGSLSCLAKTEDCISKCRINLNMYFVHIQVHLSSLIIKLWRLCEEVSLIHTRGGSKWNWSVSYFIWRIYCNKDWRTNYKAAPGFIAGMLAATWPSPVLFRRGENGHLWKRHFGRRRPCTKLAAIFSSEGPNIAVARKKLAAAATDLSCRNVCRHKTLLTNWSK